MVTGHVSYTSVWEKVLYMRSDVQKLRSDWTRRRVVWYRVAGVSDNLFPSASPPERGGRRINLKRILEVC